MTEQLSLTPANPASLSLSSVAAGNLALSRPATALNAALAQGGAVYIPRGVYELASDSLLVPSNTRVFAYGATFTSALSNGRVVGIDGSVGASIPLTSDASEGAFTVAVSSQNASSLAPGDHVRISDSTTENGAPYRDERNIVKSVSGGIVTLKFPLNFAYETSQSAKVQKVAAISGVRWYGGVFDLSGTGGETDAIQATFAYDCHVRDVTVRHHTGKAVQFWQSLGCSASRTTAENPSVVTAGHGYGVQFIYSRFCTARDTHGESCRHIVDISGGSDNLGDGITGGGSTSDTSTAAFLHGLRSRRCRFTNVSVQNCDFGIAAGNGSFGADYDFTFDGYHVAGCADGVFVTNGCSGFSVGSGNIYRSISRGLVIDQTCDNWTINGPVIDSPSSYGLDIAAQSGRSGKVVAVSLLGSGSYSIRLSGAGTIELGSGVYAKHTAGSVALNTSSFTGRLVVRGGTYTQDAGNFDILSLSGAAAYAINGATITGVNATAASSAVKATSGSKVVVVNCDISGVSEGVRLEVDGYVANNTISASGNCVRLAGSCANAYVNGNIFLAGTHLSNTAGATVTGSDSA